MMCGIIAMPSPIRSGILEGNYAVRDGQGSARRGVTAVVPLPTGSGSTFETENS